MFVYKSSPSFLALPNSDRAFVIILLDKLSSLHTLSGLAMSESLSQLSKQDPVRIVYHAANRTFARLFNGDLTSCYGRKTGSSPLHVERSLEEVKDVVRRKLGLGQETDVSLRQMIGSDALLDLEDGRSKKVY